MIDCFALLNEPRRPWLDPDRLKQKFLGLSAQYHPDRIHGAGSAEKAAAQNVYIDLNAAYQCLADSKSRLRHLLELELKSKPAEIQQIPEDLMELFMAVGVLTRKIDAFLKEKSAMASPLLRIQLFERNQECTDELAQLQQRITARHDEVLTEIQKLDAVWVGSESESPTRTMMLKRLEECYRLLSYFSRWTNQLQDRLVQLAV
jgi:DnaJ-domain-containing protein 1